MYPRRVEKTGGRMGAGLRELHKPVNPQ